MRPRENEILNNLVILTSNLGSECQNLLNQLLGVSWTLEEQLDDSGQKLQLYLSTLIL